MFDYKNGWLGFEYSTTASQWRVIDLFTRGRWAVTCIATKNDSGYQVGDTITVAENALRFLWMQQARTENTALRARIAELEA